MSLSKSKTLMAAAAAIALGTQFCLAAPAAANPPIMPVDSDRDPFYEHGDLEQYQPGDVIKTRPMPSPMGFFGVEVTQIQFRSTNSTGHPIAAVTTVLAPQGRTQDGPLLSYQHIVNALGTDCAPSKTLYSNDPDLQIREAPALNVVLQRGWTVLLPDHLGPSSAYAAGRLGGQITLDGIRAAQRVEELGLSNSPVGMAGYSGGGLATAFAAALAPEYAPELNIVGVAQGGVPTNIQRMAVELGENPHPAFGLAFAAAVGLEREYPEQVPITDQLNEAGLALRQQINDQCTNGILAMGAGKSIPMVASTTTLLEDPSVEEVMRENSVEFAPIPTAPVFEWHSPTDVLIPVDSIERTNQRYCDAGVPLKTQETPSPDHLSAAVLGMPEALDYLGDRFAGIQPPSNC